MIESPAPARRRSASGRQATAPTPAASAPRTAPRAEPPAAKKKYEPAAELPKPQETEAAAESDDDDSPAGTGFVLDPGNVGETWRRAIEKIPGLTADYARKFDRLEVSGINRVTVFFAPEHAFCKTACQRPEQVARFEQALRDVTGQTLRIEFKLSEAPPRPREAPVQPVVSPHQRIMEAAGHPLVRRASELFGDREDQSTRLPRFLK